MTDHIWVQIREVFVDRLTGLDVTTSAETVVPDVQTELVHEPNPDDLPLYSVYWNAESILDRTRDDIRRAPQFVVECWYAGANVTDWLAEMTSVAQASIEVDHNLGGLVMNCHYDGAEQTLTGEGRIRSGVIRLNFVCEVITAHGNPGLRA